VSAITYGENTRRGSRIAAVASATKSAVVGTVVRAITPHKAALTNLKAIPLTVVGTGCIDFAAFHLAHGWGWLVTGISCVVVEHLIADEDE